MTDTTASAAPMTMERAIASIGINSMGGEVFLRNMITALKMCPGLNTPEEDERLACAEYVVKHKKAYHAACQAIRDAKGRR